MFSDYLSMQVPMEFINFYPMLISLTYSVLLVLLSFFIYFKTKDIFEISKNKSLEYFRLAFLFLGVSNLIQIFLYFLRVDSSFRIFEKLSFDLVLFFNLLTLIYLTYSMFSHRVKKLSENKLLPFIFSGFIILLKNYFPNSRLIPLLFGLLLGLYFIFLFFISIFKYFKYSKKKKLHSIYLIYILLFISMFFSNVLEAFAIVLPIVSSIIYLLGVFAFVFLSMKVLKDLVI